MGEFVVAVNVGRREAVLDDDTVIPITNLLDDEGEETDDPEEAVAAVACEAEDRWHTIDLRDFTRDVN